MQRERTTKQRKAIQEVVAAAGRPLAAQEVLEAAQRSVPQLGIATVYRALNRLVKEGWATVVEFPKGPLRYERAGIGHHHHFLCTSCDGVWDVDGCPGNMGNLAPPGFEFEEHELTLYGRCEQCAA